MSTRETKIAKRTGITVAALLGCALLGLLAVANISNWDRALPWINRTVSTTLDRSFAINGELRLKWVRNVGVVHWWIPRPQISASDIVVGNPQWTRAKSLGEIHRITAVIDPLPLFRHTIVLPLLDIEKSRIVLERREDGSNNWTLSRNNDKSVRWRVVPGALRIHNSSVRLDDAKRKLTLFAEADSNDQGLRWTVDGLLNAAVLHGHGSAGSLLALEDKKTPYPIDFYLDVGSMHIGADGTLTNPSHLAALDLNMIVRGESMAQLYSVTGILLPETSQFSTEGRLIGTLNEYGGKWRYENFRGSVGNSDIEGDFSYEARPQRPLVQAKLVSNSLNFADLAPLIGADSNASKIRRNDSFSQPDDKALPAEPFKTDRWHAIDADVQFDGKKIIRPQALPLENLHAIVHLSDGVLMFKPLTFGVAGGDLMSTISLDSNKQPLRADMTILPRHLKLKELFPTIESMRTSEGEINGSAILTGSGDSFAALLGNSDGAVNVFVDRGSISKYILEAAGLNVANVVVTKLFGDRQVNLNCAAADFRVTQGVMHSQYFFIDTDIALIDIDGHISLNNEELALTVRPQSKGLRVLSLRAPLYVEGTFKKPDVNVDKEVLALRGGGAAALAAVAWPAALVPLVSPPSMGDASSSERSISEENGCVKLLSGRVVDAETVTFRL